MPENPNPTPSFIRAGGILGVPVKLAFTQSNRFAPGSTPLVVYDNTADYAQGNGALIENITVCATGTVVKTVLLIFARFLTLPGTATQYGTGEWLLWHEIDLPATGASTPSATTKDPNYPFRGTLKRLYNPFPHTGTTSFCDGIRVNGSSRPMQIGVALSATQPSDNTPLIVWLEGGEY